MPNSKKFLDAAGLTYFASKLDDYPTNEVLGTVINAIDNEITELQSYVDEKVADGLTGKSAYQIAVDNGFEGTEQEWLESLKSVLTAQDKSDIADIVLGKLPTTQGVLYGNTSN